jgi:NEDD4-binding protein 2
MKSISGSGKSSVASLIASGYNNRSSCSSVRSTDNYFMKDGKYCFDPKMLGQYHANTLRDVQNDMIDETPCIILDNTNLKSDHIKPYIKAAKHYGYSVTLIEVDCGLNEAKKRNATRSEDRKIPETVLESQYQSSRNKFDMDKLLA